MMQFLSPLVNNFVERREGEILYALTFPVDNLFTKVAIHDTSRFSRSLAGEWNRSTGLKAKCLPVYLNKASIYHDP